MLVREEGNRLHLLSVVSPDWIGQGKTVAVSQAPTYFGEVAFTLEQPQNGEAVLHLNTRFTQAPQQIVVHLPWFVDLKSATVDGKTVGAADGALEIPATAKELRLRWTLKTDAPQMSYDRAVDAYKAEYARRYQILMHGGGENQ
jgi:hypothetical protein